MWGVYLRGMAMGAADIVPGVSGGTIAFITGIYERLILALSSVDHRLIGLWRERGFKAVWQAVDGTFLALLFAGVLTSVATLARLITWLLDEQGLILWGFFFGLILGSVYLVRRAMKTRGFDTYMALFSGAIMAFAITAMAPSELPMSYLTLFLAGAIAICAMILPGVSGSFLLVIMGMYSHVLEAVKNFDVLALSVLASGCLIGLLSFTHVLRWLLKRHHDVTLAMLAGFMLGSLNKVWPWKQTLEYRINSKGEAVPLVERNILPGHYEQLTGDGAQLVAVLVAFAVGILAVVMLQGLDRRS